MSNNAPIRPDPPSPFSPKGTETSKGTPVSVSSRTKPSPLEEKGEGGSAIKHQPHPLADAVAKLYLVVLALLPFHALLTTWAGSTAGHVDVWRIWKEILIFASSAAVIWLLATDKTLRRWAFGGWLGWLVLAYVGWGIVCGIGALAAGQVNGSALVYGLFADLRFPAFMMLVAVVARLTPLLEQHWQRVIMWPLIVVAGFGLLQLLLLPDVLRHVGYGPDTIPAVQFVDNKPEYPRLQSTLRGPNPLGAYMVVGLAATVSLVCAARRRWYAVLGVAAFVVLGYTYSRSAYLGSVVAIGIAVWLLVTHGRWRRYILLAALAVAAVAAGSIVVLRNNDTVQNIAFHSDENSQSAESSNTGRARSLQNGLHDVLHNPFGNGVGTAGPASVRNTESPPRIAENYYIQVAQEMGWLGIALFTAVQAVLLRRLWPLRTTVLGATLLGSWCGLTLINMMSHAWADDTLGLLWWGLAGIALSTTMPDNQKGKRKHNTKIKHATP